LVNEAVKSVQLEQKNETQYHKFIITSISSKQGAYIKMKQS